MNSYMATRVLRCAALLILLSLFFSTGTFAAAYKYRRLGNKSDVQTTPVPGTALMGGGADLDDAFRWLCTRAAGGDFLVLRARGKDDYNSYVQGLCHLNSVSTLVIPNRKAAEDPKVADIIRHAEAVFISGGDQARYINFWQNTPVQDAINQDIAAGKPIGGTSAGLAVLGQFSFAALKDSAISKVVLQDPYNERVTLADNFLHVPQLRNMITDSHFAARDRLGRTLVFLARLMVDYHAQQPRSIAIDEKSAVLLEPNGEAQVVGTAVAYFLQANKAPDICQPNQSLTLHEISVYRVPPRDHFNFVSWSAEGIDPYQLSVDEGVIHSTQNGGSLY